MPVAVEQTMLDAISWPHESLIDSHEEGCTEGYIAELLCALLKAQGGTKALETGGFRGTTSAWLLLTLAKMGGGHLDVCEIDPERRKGIDERLSALGPLEETEYTVRGDVMAYVNSLANRQLDFVFIDDDHHPVHVEQEINALWTKVRPGGIICFHDVVGSTASIGALVKKYGGIVLDFPRLGPAGGLGILTIPA